MRDRWDWRCTTGQYQYTLSCTHTHTQTLLKCHPHRMEIKSHLSSFTIKRLFTLSLTAVLFSLSGSSCLFFTNCCFAHWVVCLPYLLTTQSYTGTQTAVSSSIRSPQWLSVNPSYYWTFSCWVTVVRLEYMIVLMWSFIYIIIMNNLKKKQLVLILDSSGVHHMIHILIQTIIGQTWWQSG